MPYTEDEWTPTRATAKTWGWVPFGLNAVAASAVIITAASLAIAGIVYALIPASTAIQVKQAQQQGTVNSAQYSATVRSLPYQQSLLTQMTTHLNNISGYGGLASTRQNIPVNSPEQQVVQSQEMSELRSFCAEGVNLISGVAPGSTQVYQTYTQNCTAGAVNSAPPLAPPAGS